ncbi:MAG TPA: long-chain-fatty-acid--CoA ligase [Acidimicrobiales bacterium]|jgi:fatty-acyl-CoA synthase
MKPHEYLAHWAELAPERECISDGARVFTYGQMNGWARRIADALTDMKACDGQRVGVLARNCPEWVAIYFGAFQVGSVPVPLNYRLNPREWVYLLNDSEATAVLVERQYASALDGLRPDLPDVRDWVVVDPDPDGDVTRGWRPLPGGEAGESPTVDEADCRVGQELWQMYTSGTTGRPKGAVLTGAAVGANVAQIRDVLTFGPGDRMFVALPLFHAGAALPMLTCMAAGGSLRIVPDFDPAACVRILDEERIDCAVLVPAMIQSMLAVPDADDRVYEHLRTIVYGASPIGADTLRRAMEVFTCDFVQFFGQTEASATLTALGPEVHRRALAGEAHLLASCGRPLVDTEVVVVGPDGVPVAAGVVGEITARGPQLMRGYWKLPDATTNALAGGWLHTGDAGRFDEEGFLYLTDRLKDMIVSGGENIYPREIEEVLCRLRGIGEVAVIGVPDERWGESVKAVIVVQAGSDLSEEAVIGWCRGHLAGYKAPRSVEFVEALPRNATGKVLKTVLREAYWHGRDRHIG